MFFVNIGSMLNSKTSIWSTQYKYFSTFDLSLTSMPLGAFLVAQMVKNLPVMWETQVQALVQEDPLEKGMATDLWDHKELDMTKQLTHKHTHLCP